MWAKVGAYAKMALILLAWIGTVIVRFHFRVEPGQAQWFMWVGAQGFCAAGFGYMLAKLEL